jgi:hypothetical protein
MDVIKPYKKHGLYKLFTRKFIEALSIVDEEDKKKVPEALLTRNEIWDDKLMYEPRWLWKRVKRKVASPNVLIPVLKSLFLSFGTLKCDKSNRTLFDKLAWKQALSLLATVELGYAYNPPGIQLYFKTGKKGQIRPYFVLLYGACNL